MSIKIVGVGDAGSIFASKVHQENSVNNPHTISLNTSAMLNYEVKTNESYVFEGSGLGASGNPMLGRQIAEKNKDFLFNLLDDTEFLIITAGMGCGTGTGAAHVVAYVAREMRIPTVGVVSTPYDFEGSQRQKIAKLGIRALRKFADTVVTVEGESIRDRLRNDYRPQIRALSLPISGHMKTLQFFVREEIYRQLDIYHDSL